MISNTDKSIHSECLTWKPIFAGALIAIGLSFLLNLFSAAIGLTAFTTNTEGVETLAFGGLLGTAIGILFSMFAAGWVAGYLGRYHSKKRHMGALYGFLTWCVALIVTIFLVSYAQQYITFYTHVISGTGNTFQVTAASAMGNLKTTVSNVSTNNLVISTYILFCLFFLSAFSSSIGGHCGMRHVCRDEM